MFDFAVCLPLSNNMQNATWFYLFLFLTCRQKWSEANLSSFEPIPPAPHLEDCWLDRKDRDGESPHWWRPDPNPPWVRGCDSDNLPLTRRAQADIWRNQNPPTCRDVNQKFAIARWAPHGAFGLGAQLHVMTGVLGLAMAFNRTLVVLPRSFERAAHEGCKGIGPQISDRKSRE